jgi:hypothetical protein
LGRHRGRRLLAGADVLASEDGADHQHDQTEQGGDGAEADDEQVAVDVLRQRFFDHMQGEADRGGVDVEVIETGIAALELGHRAEGLDRDLVRGLAQADAIAVGRGDLIGQIDSGRGVRRHQDVGGGALQPDRGHPAVPDRRRRRDGVCADGVDHGQDAAADKEDQTDQQDDRTTPFDLDRRPRD